MINCTICQLVIDTKQSIDTLVKAHVFFMPLPLGAGGIMFSGCPSVRPPEAWNTLFWPVHGSVGPPDQPWPFYGMSVRPSVHPSVHPSVRWGFRAFAWERMEGMTGNCLVKQVKFGVSGHFPENTWRKWPEILHADVSWPPSEWLVYGHHLLIFLIWALFWLSELSQIWGFRAFPGERMEEMAWNFARWCILTTYSTDQFIATVW